jgi:hypothetical protein
MKRRPNSAVLQHFQRNKHKRNAITITKRQEAAPTTAKEEGWPIERWIITAGVIVFLAVAALLIYRMMKKTRVVESAPPEM